MSNENPDGGELTDTERALRDSPLGEQIDDFLADPYRNGLRRKQRPQRYPDTSLRSSSNS